MLPRERVINAVNHKPIDRFPRDLGGVVSGISKIAYKRLLNYLDINFNSIFVYDSVQQLAEVNTKILKKFKIDTRHIRMNTSKDDKIVDNTFKDIYGIKFQRFGTRDFPTLYFEMVEFPLEKANIEMVRNFQWPKPKEEWFLECRKKAKEYYDNGFALVANPTGGGIQETVTWLRGNEQFLKDLYVNRELIEELLDLVLENQLEIIKAYLESLDNVDIYLYADDYGNQDRLMMRPQMWREMIKPRVRKLISSIKKSFPTIKIQLHSCGSILPIIPDLIEIGFDILNPVQPNAKNMDHVLFKEKYGNKLCFHGGFDIQYTLPKGTQEEIFKEVERVVTSLGSNKTGYIFAMAHNILADVPAENIVSIYNILDNLEEKESFSTFK